MGASFTIVNPVGAETPLVVEVPHAGLAIDGPSLALLTAPASALGRDADLWVDELYQDAPRVGAHLLVANMSRYVVDLNRAETDIDAETVVGGPSNVRASRGVVWRLTSEGHRALGRPLLPEELDRRIRGFHRPYHEALRRLIEHKKERFGYATVLAAHSMPSRDRELHPHGVRQDRADVVSGTRGRTSASPLFLAAIERLARDAGLSLAHDVPYAGGFTTQYYGRPERGVHVVQVELARSLYMDETTLHKSRDFARTQSWCRELVTVMGATVPSL